MLRAAEKPIFLFSQISVICSNPYKKKQLTTLPGEEANYKLFPKKTFLIHSALVPDSETHNSCKQHLGLQDVSCLLDIEDCDYWILKCL